MRSMCRNQMISFGCLRFTREKRWKNKKKETCAHQMSEPSSLDFGAPPVFSSILEHKRLCDPSYEVPDGPLGFGWVIFWSYICPLHLTEYVGEVLIWGRINWISKAWLWFLYRLWTKVRCFVFIDLFWEVILSSQFYIDIFRSSKNGVSGHATFILV